MPQEQDECLTKELATVTLSVFDDAGLMRKIKESALFKMFSDAKGKIHESGTKYATDGSHLIHRVVCPKHRSFADVSATCVYFIQKHYGKEVAVIFMVTS